MNFSNEDSKDMNYRNSLTGVLVFFFPAVQMLFSKNTI